MMQHLLRNVTEVSIGAAVENNGPNRAFQAVVAGTGAVSATVLVEVSNNNVDFLTLGTITLSGTTRATDGFASDAPWRFIRGNVTAISGTSASVNLLMAF